MNKGTLWICFILFLAYLMLMFCAAVEATANDNNTNLSNNTKRTSINTNTDLSINRQFNLKEEARKRHSIYHRYWWWHALAIAYWVKVKVIIVGFFVGSAIFVGLRYFWPHKCHGEVFRESPVIYDHPPSFSHDHDHAFSSSPYSSSFDTPSFDPSGGVGDIGGGGGGIGATGPYTYDIGTSGSDVPHIKRRSIKKLRAQRDLRLRQREEQRRQAEVPQLHTPTEEQIGDMMFYFLGLDSKACKRRFICEMEFRSRLHPLTSMAFRIIGRSFFGKYTNARNDDGQAKSFDECAAVNAECVFIEQGQEGEQEEGTEIATEQAATETVENSIENELTAEAGIVNNQMEQQNVANLKVERRTRRHRHTSDLVAQRIWARAN